MAQGLLVNHEGEPAGQLVDPNIRLIADPTGEGQNAQAVAEADYELIVVIPGQLAGAPFRFLADSPDMASMTSP